MFSRIVFFLIAWQLSVHLLIGGDPRVPKKGDGLSGEQAKAIRKVVYSGGLVYYTDKKAPGMLRRLGIPDELKECFEKKPVPTLKLLKQIVLGARPQDAIKAAAFVTAVCGQPEGAVIVSYEDPKTFDEEDEVGSGHTPRKIYAEFIEEKIQAASKGPPRP